MEDWLLVKLAYSSDLANRTSSHSLCKLEESQRKREIVEDTASISIPRLNLGNALMLTLLF